jgi:N-acetylglutamate synthase-like GNAT family acetyltransferase
LSYSHLGPGKAAEFISLTTEGSSQTAVVVFVHDSEGNRYAIRHPAHPKEIARLHKMFSNASLPVEFRPEHQFLVMLNEHVQVIGGLFYRQTDPECVHLEKVVVDERYRKKGLSEGLLHEFFNRLISQGVKNVTVGFLRPQYFYRFGFKIDERYGNMVKELDTEASKERKEAEFVESI